VSQYFKSCFENKRHADVELILNCDDECSDHSACATRALSTSDIHSPIAPAPTRCTTILAHKVILAAKSCFFRSLFDGGWAEQTGPSTQEHGQQAHIDTWRQRVALDAQVTPFLHVLEHLYTDSFDAPRACASLDAAVEVLQCASMLQLSACRDACEQEVTRRYLTLGQLSVSGVDTILSRGGVRLDYSAQELAALEQQAVYLVSVADTFHCETLARAALEQVRLCRNVLYPTASSSSTSSCGTVPLAGNPSDSGGGLTTTPCDTDCGTASALYSEFIESLSPAMSRRLQIALDPSSVLFLPE
jgi:hypothetical protein